MILTTDKSDRHVALHAADVDSAGPSRRAASTPAPGARPPPPDRGRLLYKLAEKIRSQTPPSLAELALSQFRTQPIVEAEYDIARRGDLLEYYAGLAIQSLPRQSVPANALSFTLSRNLWASPAKSFPGTIHWFGFLEVAPASAADAPGVLKPPSRPRSP